MRLALAGLFLGGLAATPSLADSRTAQPEVESRVKPVIQADGLRFRDADGDGFLAPYEDWRRSAQARADDLLARMTLREKLGQLVHGTLPGVGGALGRSTVGYDLAGAAPLILTRHITSFITRLSLPPRQMAEQSNAIQALAEQGRLGIPVTISADPRNHFHHVLGQAESAAGVTQWPEAIGFAALGDEDRLSAFATIVRSEYRAVGIHQALSPQVDLVTEPRWNRIIGTFGSDPGLASRLGGAYVAALQGAPHGLTRNGVMAVTKHWVGYGAQPDGFDAHSYYGREITLTNAQFKRHVAAFAGPLAAHTAGIMPAYPIVRGVTVGGQPVEPVGAGFSKALITRLLRGRLGYNGIVLSDWAITADCNTRCSAPTVAAPQRVEDISTAWGLEHSTVDERFTRGVEAGIDQFGGTEDVEALARVVQSGRIRQERVDASVRRILISKFSLGLFDNPYVDPSRAEVTIARPAHHQLAERTQAEAQVLLTNNGLLPLGKDAKVWVFGADPAAVRAAGLRVADSLAEADVALIRTDAPGETLHPHHFFGRRQKEGRLDFRDGDPAYEALKAASAAHVPVLLSIFVDRPAILTNIKDRAAAILANFGASDAAVLQVAMGERQALGRLPFELPSSMEAVERQNPAVADDSAKPLFKAGYGLGRHRSGLN